MVTMVMMYARMKQFDTSELTLQNSYVMHGKSSLPEPQMFN